MWTYPGIIKYRYGCKARNKALRESGSKRCVIVISKKNKNKRKKEKEEEKTKQKNDIMNYLFILGDT